MSTLNYILHPGEIEFYITQLTVSKLEELGTLRWFEKHKRLQQLHQQSVLEANESFTEKVKELVIFNKKLVTLVHEAVTISVWREKILPEICKKNIESMDVTFPIYVIMYHETTALGLLQNILYHQDSAEELGDSAVDLVDYCVQNILQLITCHKDVDVTNKVLDLTAVEDLKKKETDIAFDIGTRSVSVLRYLAESIENLPLSVTTRIYQRHDVPLLMCQLLEISPWRKKDDKGQLYKYNDSKWKKTGVHQESVITVTEGQVWLLLRHILMDQRAQQHYEIDDCRRNQILKVQRHLTEVVLDQISPLIDLKYYFSSLEMGGDTSRDFKKPFIIEVVAEFRENLINQSKKYWKKLAKMLLEMLANEDDSKMRELAKCLASAYDTLDRVDGDAPICSYCGDPASKFCSKCKNEYYCGRECQVKAWPKHKNICSVIQGEKTV